MERLKDWGALGTGKLQEQFNYVVHKIPTMKHVAFIQKGTTAALERLPL